jgi:NTE family protein
MGILRMFGFKKKKRKVTLVLGGGSARGITHIGVLKVFKRERIPVDEVVGTSIGAFVGAAYCLGIPISTMEEKALWFTWDKAFDPTIPKMAILEGKKLENVIKDFLDNKTFSDTKIPLHVVTTDIETGEEVVLSSGDLTKSVRASCSWPGIFNPVEIGGRLLVDGGIKNSVPTKIAKMLGAELVIACDVGFCVKRGKIENMLQVLLQTFQITGEELNKYQSGIADILIKPKLGDIDQFTFNRSKEAIRIGEAAAEEKMGEIKSILEI